MDEIQKNIMRNFTKNYLVICLMLILFVCQSLVAQEFVKPPNGLIVEGVQPIPSFIKSRFDKKTTWKSARFLSWSAKGVIASSGSLSLIKSPLAEPEEIKVDLFDRDEFGLQPKIEKHILFTKDNNGNEITQLYKYNLETKQEVQLTNPSEIEFVGSFIWSANGDAIYLTNRKEKENIAEIYLLNPESKEIKRLASMKGDTKYISAVSDKYLIIRDFLANNHTTYYLMDLETNQINQITKEIAFVRGAKFSQKNNGVYWLSNKEGKFSNLYFYNIEKQTTKKVNQQELNLSEFAVSTDEKNIAFKVNEYGAEKIRLFQLDGAQLGKEILFPKLPESKIGQMQWKNETELGFDFESFKTPSQVLSYDIVTNKLQTWTKNEFNEEISNKVDDAKLIKWKSFDGREITGFIVKPKNLEPNRKIPVIIDIHGGPKAQFQPEFDASSCFFIAELTVAKIFPNIRGSSGFGKKFEELDNREKREDAVKDLQALLDWIKSQPDLDAEKVFAYGESYGGFMALALGLKEPNRIRGIVADSPLISKKSDILASSEKIREITKPEYGSLEEVNLMNQIEKLSVLGNDLKDWKTPVLLSVGKNDTRIPPKDVREFHQRLTKLNKESWLLEAENEGHSWNNWNNYTFLKYSMYVFYKRNMF